MPLVLPPIERYPNCQYVVKNPATWNPASFTAADLDGASSVAVGDRILCPSGTYAGIRVATSATAATADSSFVTLEGYTVRCVRSAGAPTYRQTAASGTAIPEFLRLDACVDAVSDAGGAVSGEVVRLSSTGVLAKAQADSASHAASILGVWDGANVIPFSASPVALFDSAPIVGRPCYLSITAGKLTSARSIFSLSIPENLLVIKDTSVGAAYSAQVGISFSTAKSSDARGKFLEDSATTLGVDPQNLISKFEDFEQLAATTGFPLFGASSFAVSGSAFSTTPTRSTVGLIGAGYPMWTVNLGGGVGTSIANVLTNAAVSAQAWKLRVRFRQTTADLCKLYLQHAAGYETIGLMNANYGNPILGVGHGDFDPIVSDPSAPQFVSVFSGDTAWHILDMRCLGDGTISVGIDDTVLSFTLTPSASTAVPSFVALGRYLEIDYWGFASVRAQ